jgi:hypothetical protein
MTIRADEIALLNLFQYSGQAVQVDDHLGYAHFLDFAGTMIEVHTHGWEELVTVHARTGFLNGVDEILALLVLTSGSLGVILSVGLVVAPTLRLTVMLLLVTVSVSLVLLIYTVPTTTGQPVLVALHWAEL